MSAGEAVTVLSSTGAIGANQFPLEIPTIRFKPFNELSATSRNIAEEKLGYLEVTWNVHGLAPVESSGWTSLTSDEQAGAGMLGYTPDTWDCFINHFEDATWDELAERGVQDHFRRLGWTQAHWDQTTDDVPHTEARWWGQLTDDEKRAANGICYFEDNWDRVDMNPNPTYFPHPPPLFRYRPWSELDSVTKNLATGMMNYTEGLWDAPGSSVLEKNTFLNLDADVRGAALELGFYTHTWDCFMNHYLSYYWSSFHDELKVAVETLGWTEAIWTQGGPLPESENMMWTDLTSGERAAATRLCYFREIWDGEPIVRWYDYDEGENTAVSGEGPVPDDIDLGIFAETGYAGKLPGEVGVVAVSDVPKIVSVGGRTGGSFTASGLALVLSMRALLFG